VKKRRWSWFTVHTATTTDDVYGLIVRENISTAVVVKAEDIW
jgi:hypothetical protein